MDILITGNMGYVGSVLVQYLKSKYPHYKIIGIDVSYFNNLNKGKKIYKSSIDFQIKEDIRNILPTYLEGVDCVIHLAAVSNDPIGNEFIYATRDINYFGTIKLAKLCKNSGVKNFIFASSCSVYGSGGEKPKKESDKLDPLTEYAKSKVNAEKELVELISENFIVTCLRFATACGTSPNLRLDLVLNDFVVSAYLNNEIRILSDGSPWRPLIDTYDMSRAIDWAIHRLSDYDINCPIINIGSNNTNYSILEIAEIIKKSFSSTKIFVNKNANPDKRSYKVDFSLFENIAQNYKPIVNIEESISKLIDEIQHLSIPNNFRDSSFIRLNVLKKLKEANLINDGLYFINQQVEKNGH